MGKAVREDLHGLEISAKELQKLTNLPVKDELIIITRPLTAFFQKLIDKIKGSEGPTVVFMTVSMVVLGYLVFDIAIKIFAPWVTIPSWIVLIMVSLWLAGITQISFYSVWVKKQRRLRRKLTNSLERLLNDVDRYNDMIKAIDINDQIEAAGNPGVIIQERERVIAALELTRLDLIRAVKTERILRENRQFISNNTQLFANNIATLVAIQVREEATEHGRLLNEALQIALNVKLEMERLQTQNQGMN